MRVPSKALIVILIAFLAVVVATIVTTSTRNEPQYQGRALSRWLEIYYDNSMTQTSPEFNAAAQAVRDIGTNAISYLLKWIRQEPPAWQRSNIRNLPEPVLDNSLAKFVIHGPHSERANAAVLGFGILGTNAASALPELNSMMKDSTHPRTASRAIMALSSLGPQAFPYLTAALADTNQISRFNIAGCLAVFTVRYVGTNACLPPLTSALTDPDPLTRHAAQIMLRRLTPEAPTNASPQ